MRRLDVVVGQRVLQLLCVHLGFLIPRSKVLLVHQESFQQRQVVGSQSDLLSFVLYMNLFHLSDFISVSLILAILIPALIVRQYIFTVPCKAFKWHPAHLSHAWWWLKFLQEIHKSIYSYHWSQSLFRPCVSGFCHMYSNYSSVGHTFIFFFQTHLTLCFHYLPFISVRRLLTLPV